MSLYFSAGKKNLHLERCKLSSGVMDDDVVQRVFQEGGRDYYQQQPSTSSSSPSILQSLPLHVVYFFLPFPLFISMLISLDPWNQMSKMCRRVSMYIKLWKFFASLELYSFQFVDSSILIQYILVFENHEYKGDIFHLNTAV